MITKIAISDYRSCINTSFSPHPNLSVLIGPNSAGKSNVLNGILLLKRLVAEEEFLYNRVEKATGQCQIKVWFDIEGKKLILTSIVDIFTDENNNDVVVSSKQYWTARDFTGNLKHIKLPLFLIDDIYKLRNDKRIVFRSRNRKYFLENKFPYKVPLELLESLYLISTTLREMRYYSASQFTNPSDCPVSFEIEKTGRQSRGIRLRRHAKFLYDLYRTKKNEDSSSYQQFFEIVGPNSIGLVDNIQFKEMSTSSIDYSVKSGGKVEQRKREKVLVIPQFVIGNNILSPNQLSEGTFKTITLLFYLMTESSRLLLIEEPEVCVHHGLLSSIIELIKTYSDDKQIVVSTHSDFVLDEVDPMNVYRVENTLEKGTTVMHIPKAMSRKELSALREYLQSEGNLGEYWRHGGLD